MEKENGNRRGIYRMELKRAFFSKKFYLAIFLGCLITGIQAYSNYAGYRWQQVLLAQNDKLVSCDLSSAFVGAMFAGGDSLHWTYPLYYFLIPILVVMPHAVSYLQDKKSGYVKNILAGCLQRDYYRAKYLAVFCSGGVAALFPLVFNLMLNALYLPLVTVHPVTNAGGGPNAMWAWAYYHHTWLYLLGYAFLIFFFGGLAASLALVTSRYSDYLFTAWITPFLFCMVLYNLAGSVDLSLVPFYYLQGSQGVTASIWIILAEYSLMALLEVGLFLRKGEQEDVF